MHAGKPEPLHQSRAFRLRHSQRGCLNGRYLASKELILVVEGQDPKHLLMGILQTDCGTLLILFHLYLEPPFLLCIAFQKLHFCTHITIYE
jgi:hypothetical protein